MTRLVPTTSYMALALLAGGCASLQDLTAAHTGCQPSEITIVEDHRWSSGNWVAECGGRRYQCAEVSGGRGTLQTSCAPESGSARRVERVQETGDDGTRFWVLRVGFENDGRSFLLTSTPVRDATRVLLTISAPQPQLRFGCPVGLMTDGEITRLEVDTSRSSEGRRSYEVVVSTDLVRRVAQAERVSGRICDDEWVLGPDEQEVLRELLTRIEEELAWAGQATSGDDAPAQEAGGQI